ncbi:MAG: LytTR family transcriptional regulator [Firmicutes bacterium]|nr:LytTR family transcriptional regulator [Bacillota bacterium]
MKIRLAVNREKYPLLQQELESLGIEIDDTADLQLCEAEERADQLLLKHGGSGDMVLVEAGDIIYIESFGHKLELHTATATYSCSEPLYRLLLRLNSDRFLRISNSVIINCDRLQRISPTLSMKFVLTMSNGARVDVTRSYYYIFKERFGI